MIIAVVGSRKMSDYGKRVVAHLVPGIIARGWKVVTASVAGVNQEVIKQGAEVVSGANMYEVNVNLAKMADKLIIVEGGEKSGTILVAKEAIELGKEVWVVPGRWFDQGSKIGLFLIRNGAKVLTEVADLE